MNGKDVRNLILSVLIGSTLLFSSGCGKKEIEPPQSAAGGNSAFSGSGTDIQYPLNENGSYSETNIGSTGTLDDTSVGSQGGGLSVNQENGDEARSEEFNKEHGRSSMGLSPIYYNFDQSTIRPDMFDRMANNSVYLKEVSGAKVVIEGNCDVRGTNEYNIALGQRRAMNAKAYLVNMGIDPQRIRTVSYGEERPLFPGEDETSHALNRRSDFVIE